MPLSSFSAFGLFVVRLEQYKRLIVRKLLFFFLGVACQKMILILLRDQAATSLGTKQMLNQLN